MGRTIATSVVRESGQEWQGIWQTGDQLEAGMGGQYSQQDIVLIETQHT